MPVKHGLLALLAEGPAHGYQLKAAFEARTGGSWQLNIGQVYSTLHRLERDGLTATVASDGDRNIHELTSAGRKDLERWYATPIVPVPPPRDELAVKVLLAIGAPDVDAYTVLQRQRNAIVGHLQDLTRRKRDLDPDRDLEELLHLDALLFRAEAEVRWLDLCEARLRQRSPGPEPPPHEGPEPADRPFPPRPDPSTTQDRYRPPHTTMNNGGTP
jgi:DNA-binding PadR family transcriptional regulator